MIVKATSLMAENVLSICLKSTMIQNTFILWSMYSIELAWRRQEMELN